MSDEKRKKPSGEFDIFITNSLYPEAAPIFTYSLKPLDQIKSDCIVVIDTNALLVPYNIGKESLQQIERTYTKLVSEKRLFIPGQVVREFARNRANKITELFQQLSRKRSGAQTLQKGKYPLLEALQEYQDVVRLEGEIDSLVRQYRDAIGKVLDHVQNWAWDDPVSLLYSKLFTKDVVHDLNIDKESLRGDLERRRIHSIPPGYKDSGKEDDGIGDLLIWHTILEIGKKHKKSVLFISGDEKADWWHRSESQALYPRYELVDEFRRSSDGQSFYIIAFSRFLDLYGASEIVVEEVRQEEISTRAEESIPELDVRSSYPLVVRSDFEITAIIQDWLKSNYNVTHIYEQKEMALFRIKKGRVRSDIIFSNKDTSITAVEIVYVEAFQNQGNILFSRIRDRAISGSFLLNEGHVGTYIVIVVSDNRDKILEVARKFEKPRSRAEKVSYVFGYINQNDFFVKLFDESDFLA